MSRGSSSTLVFTAQPRRTSSTVEVADMALAFALLSPAIPLRAALHNANASWCSAGPTQHVPARYGYATTGSTLPWRDQVRVVHRELLAAGLALSDEQYDIYQFGVLGGGSLRLLRRIFPRTRVFGFDTFEGVAHTIRAAATATGARLAAVPCDLAGLNSNNFTQLL